MKKHSREMYETDRDVTRRPRRQKESFCIKCDIGKIEFPKKICPVCGRKYNHWRKTEDRRPKKEYNQGDIAQLGERFDGIEKVIGSTPIISTLGQCE